MKINLIVAGCRLNGNASDFGIGQEGQLPWRLKQELKHFATLTKYTKDEKKQNAVLMGRKTWESIPLKFRPLRDRYNMILTSKYDYEMGSESADKFSSLESAMHKLKNMDHQIETCWIIGGSSIYNEALKKGICERIYLTIIDHAYHCDTFFPKIDSVKYGEISDPLVDSKLRTETVEGLEINYRFHVYERK